jgi:hypothetical protein
MSDAWKTVAMVNIESLQLSGTWWGNSRETDRYRRFLRESCFDAMTNFAAQQWATDFTLPLLIRRRKESLCPHRFSDSSDLSTADTSKQKLWMKKHDMNVPLHSYRDIQFAASTGVKSRIPNGASEEEFLEKSYENRPSWESWRSF